MLGRLLLVILMLSVLLLPVHSRMVTVDDFDHEVGVLMTEDLDKLTLKMNLEPSYDFGITTDNYVQSASHTSEITLGYTENRNMISSTQESPVFVYYRAKGPDSFKLYLSIEEPLEGTVYEDNTDKIGWEVKWKDDKGKSRFVSVDTLGNVSYDSNDAEKGYVLTYTKPADELGDSDLWPLDSISITQRSMPRPDIYKGTLRLTMEIQ